MGAPDVVQGPMEGPSMPGGGFSSGGYSVDAGGGASGGSFSVPGSGGTDSTAVRFMATPGERVDVLTPGQQAANAGGDGDVIVQLIDSGATTPPRVEVDKQLEAAVIKIVFNNVQQNGPLRGLLRG